MQNRTLSIVFMLSALHGLIGVAPAAGQSPPLARTGLDGARLTPGIWTYEISVEMEGEEQRIGTRALEILRVRGSGRPVWLIIETNWHHGSIMVDSLHLDGLTMRPLRRAMHLGTASMHLGFSSDSVQGTIRSPSGTRSFAATLPTDAVINAGMTEVLLRLHALSDGWAASANLATIGASGHVQALPTRLAIGGEETITVPAGSFRTWALVSSAPDRPDHRLWLSRDGQWLVRSIAPVRDLAGATLKTVLIGQTTVGR